MQGNNLFVRIAGATGWRSILYVGTLLGLALPLSSCQSEPSTQAAKADGSVGTLVVRANGEDFIRQGFTDKDGWEMSFDTAYVTLSDVSALQTEPPFEAGAGESPQVEAQLSSDRAVTVDLTIDEPTVAEFVEAPAGRYNALTWQLSPAETGEAAGYSVLLVGTATKAGEQLPFQIGLNDALTFTCGDYIGDNRKGILDKSETADVEATFHFDHLFGDGEAAADDEINTGALGFEPLAALAQDGAVNVDSETLQKQLSEEDYRTLQAVLPSLGHVGEGHCEATAIAQ